METFWNIIHQGLLGMYLGGSHGLSDAAFSALLIAGHLLCMAAGYLLGSVNTAIILSRIKYGADIRDSGSGNAGMTNVLRTYGAGSAGVTLLGDAAKTLVSYIIGTLLLGIRGAYFACFMCVVGHIFPLYYKFQGGKGIVCAGMMILLLNPLAFLIILAVFGAVSASSGAGDFYNVYNALTQMPRGALTYLYGFNSYWYMPESK